MNYPDCLGVKQTFSDEKREPGTTCDCKSKQHQYFLFNKNHAVPEYIVEFEYLFKNASENVFEKLLLHQLDERAAVAVATREDETALALEMASFESLVDDGETLDKEKSDALANHQLTELNMHNMRMCRDDMKLLERFVALRKLVLSFNNLTSLDDLVNLVCQQQQQQQ